MTDQQSNPGWYPDTDQPGQERFWDGETWTDRRRHAAPSGPPAASSGAKPGSSPDGRWKTWQLVAAAALTFFVGIGVGGAGDVATETSGERTPQEVKTVTVPAPAEDEPVATAEPAPPGSSVTAGDFTFSDVQVSEDGMGDFQVRARAVNGGGDKESVGIKATILSGGSVVGTATGVVNGWPSGETRTVEMLSVDDYQDSWDSVEFQIEFEF